MPAIYEKGLCNALKALYQLQWKVNWLRSCLYQNICKICSAFKNNQSWFWRLYCQFLTYIVCLNGVTVAYCKVLVNNIIVTVSVLQGTNNICFKCIFYNEWDWLLASVRFQWKLLKIPFEVHSEIPKIEILFRKLKKLKAVWLMHGFVQF